MANTDLSDLTKSSSADQLKETLALQDSPSSVDDVLEHIIGDFGFRQLNQSILVSLVAFFDAQQTFISVYTDLEPKWHCTINGTTTTTPCSSSFKICQHSKNQDWAWDDPLGHGSIISEWSLECSSSFIIGLPESSYLMGCLIGGFVVAMLVGDSLLGRKNLLFLSFLVFSVFSLLTSFSTNILMYSAMRFASGLGRASLLTGALVLLMERLGRFWRSKLGIMVLLAFNLGILSLPAIAYVNRGSSWKVIYLWTSLPAIVYCVLAYFFVDESPRWLIMQGRREETKKVLAKLSSRNVDSIANMKVLAQETPDMANPNPNPSRNPYLSIKNLFKKRWALKRLFLAMPLGFGVGIMYFGMLLGVGDIGFNIFLTILLNGIVLIPSQFLTFFFIGTWKRRNLLLAFFTISGYSSIVFAILGNTNVRNKAVLISLELTSLFCANSAFNVLMVYTAELFPTCVRNAATSMVRQALMFAAVFVPTLIAAGKNNEFFSYGVFGLTILICGLSVVRLPETRGTTFCDTMDEQERKDNTTIV